MCSVNTDVFGCINK